MDIERVLPLKYAINRSKVSRLVLARLSEVKIRKQLGEVLTQISILEESMTREERWSAIEKGKKGT